MLHAADDLLVAETEVAAESRLHFTSGETIPDDDAAGLADCRWVTLGIPKITDIEVHLEIVGGWFGSSHVPPWLRERPRVTVRS